MYRRSMFLIAKKVLFEIRNVLGVHSVPVQK